MGNYYVSDVNVFVAGGGGIIIRVAGLGYNPNEVKSTAENYVRETNKGKKITSVIAKNNLNLTLAEFEIATGNSPHWLIMKEH